MVAEVPQHITLTETIVNTHVLISSRIQQSKLDNGDMISTVDKSKGGMSQ